MNSSVQHLAETRDFVAALDPALMERIVEGLAAVRDRGGRCCAWGIWGR